MTITTILIGLALLILTIPFVVGPLLRRVDDGRTTDNGRTAVADKREQVLLALRDLDFDHKIGKVTDEDYAALRVALLAEAAAVIEADDRYRSEIEAQIEAEVQARRSRHRLTGSSAAVRPEARFCTQCGASLRPGDRFCSECGAPVGKGEQG